MGPIVHKQAIKATGPAHGENRIKTPPLPLQGEELKAAIRKIIEKRRDALEYLARK